jgi:16S rRNA (cytosine967-C5)-methyltransferase
MSVAPRAAHAPGSAALAAAARALAIVVDDGRTAEDALEQVAFPAAETAAVRAIHSGTLRWYLRLAPLVDALLQPGQRMAPAVHALLVTTLHQLEYSRAAPHSVVNIAVDAARVLGHRGAAGFVNALLRRFLRERAALVARVEKDAAAAAAHPRWLLDALRAAHPDSLAQILAADNEAPAMVLRVNLARGTRESALVMLAGHGIDASAGLASTSIVLDRPCDVADLPGFSEGLLSVQDAGAQFAAELLDAQPRMRVLDACAAPGGKTGHILERTPDVNLLALDVDAARLERVAQNLQRLQLQATLRAADLLADGWWDGRRFDRILLDAPCSGTGVIRRHPDIKLLRRPQDGAGFAAQQRALLRRCAALLAPGGRILYATCSVLREENQQVVDAFLAAHGDFSRAGADRLLLPSPRAAGAAALTDGFYYACLQMKRAGA